MWRDILSTTSQLIGATGATTDVEDILSTTSQLIGATGATTDVEGHPEHYITGYRSYRCYHRCGGTS